MRGQSTDRLLSTLLTKTVHKGARPPKLKKNNNKFLEDISPFCGATDTPVLDFWWCLLWFSKPEPIRQIYKKERIKDFPKAPPPRGTKLLFDQIFPQNCMKIKKMGPGRTYKICLCRPATDKEANIHN